MHIPDGMLDTATWAGSWAVSAGLVGVAVRRVRRLLTDARLVLMAVLAALVFALQMLNFPVPGGTSGHFAGGAAAAILLGPWPAALVLSAVLVVQALVFADGGVTALGANILNLALVAPFAGYWVYAALLGGRPAGTAPKARLLLASFSAAWAAVVASALAAALEIAASGAAPLVVVAGSMGTWHAMIGIGEGAVTAGLVGYLLAVRPDLLRQGGEPTRRTVALPAAVLAGVALAGAALSSAASSFPDGLERAYDAVGRPFAERTLRAPLAGYALPSARDPELATALAGVVGVVLTAVGAATAFGLLRRGLQSRHETGSIHRHAHRHESEPEHAHPHHHAADGHEHRHALSFEALTYRVSPVHGLDPRVKIVGVLVLVVALVLTAPLRLGEAVALAAMFAAVTLLARLPLRRIAARSALVLPFAGTIALFAPLRGRLGALSPEGIAGAFGDGGWLAAWSIVGTAVFSVYALNLLAATTPAPSLLRGLASLRVPDVLLTLLSFVYRYADALRGQVRSGRNALAARGGALPLRTRAALLGHLAGSLFVRAYDRGERVYQAMVARGYDGMLPTPDELRLTGADALASATVLLTATALVLY